MATRVRNYCPRVSRDIVSRVFSNTVFVSFRESIYIRIHSEVLQSLAMAERLSRKRKKLLSTQEDRMRAAKAQRQPKVQLTLETHVQEDPSPGLNRDIGKVLQLVQTLRKLLNSISHTAASQNLSPNLK